ncbi:hypothetical protein [Pedobacter hiemivivus]|uniref:Uncharacterized protein n=1 Tax=Pedobacter hiemivivus TaxID=2530454 RepID=A0A4R0M9G3_9SPHI|nr:hypothetical protein [Pedobacter hiemivivus]TCC82697.1 hypothetical protein EZ444_26510 [Pedobacter hiemivivus]
MKFLALFLSIVVITLTITPCCALEVAETHAHETAQKENHECNEKSDECCKDCSPFYVCGTCIGFIFTSEQVLTFAIQLKPVQHNTAYIPVGLPIIPTVIWQPPKLV